MNIVKKIVYSKMNINSKLTKTAMISAPINI